MEKLLSTENSIFSIVMDEKLENSLPEVKDTPELDFSKSSLNEIMRYMQSEVFGVLEYFDYYAKKPMQKDN